MELRLNNATPFDLDTTLQCGQLFRWQKREKWWYGVIGKSVVKIQQRRNLLDFEGTSQTFMQNYFRLQDDLQTRYTGGTVLHIFLGEHVNDMQALKGLIRKVATNYRLPYFTLTPTFSICPSHGYLDGEQPTCSICDRETEVYSRVVGYLRPVRQWNEGKQAEYGNRKIFKVAS